MKSQAPLSTIDNIGLSAAQGGIVVEGSILGLEQQSHSNLNFISSCSKVESIGKLYGRQVLVSEDAHRMLSHSHSRTAFLACKYMHPLSLGNITVELLPSGESPGSCFLLIRKGDQSILYASHWSLEGCSYLRKAVLRKVDKILLHLENEFSSSSLSSKHETDRLETQISKHFSAGKSSALVVDPIRDAPRLMPTLLNWRDQVVVDEAIAPYFSFLAESLPLGAQLEPFSTWGKSKRRLGEKQPSLVVLSRQSLDKRREHLSSETEIIQTCFPHETKDGVSLNTSQHLFLVSPPPSVTDVLKLVHETDAKEVIVHNSGALATHCSQILRQNSIPVSMLSSPQTSTLF